MPDHSAGPNVLPAATTAAASPAITEEFRAEIRRRLAEKREQRAAPSGPAPRYDGVYFAGMAWLDSL